MSRTRKPDQEVRQPPPLPPVFDRRRLFSLPAPKVRARLLTGMRIRKKLVVLHTVFSLALAGVLLLALRPAVSAVVERAEADEARTLLTALAPGLATRQPSAEELARIVPDATLRFGDAAAMGLTGEQAERARASDLSAVSIDAGESGGRAALHLGSEGKQYAVLEVRIPEARAAVRRLYLLLSGALLAVYGLVAVALEVFVLPQNVYDPIRRMLAADDAVQRGEKTAEIIPDELIPADELGEIMRSRNDSIAKLRTQEKLLADALQQLEVVANDLRRKNHLLEAAQRNLADADRLASLGMMSAGIAHELNTPLAVLKGLVETLNADPAAGMEPAQAALMLRVVGRLERLGDSLLDFARVRPPVLRSLDLRALVDEAVTLVTLDRESVSVQFVNAVPEGDLLLGDGDRLVQVLVNLLRNAAQAIAGDRRVPRGAALDRVPPSRREVRIEAEPLERDGRPWLTVRIIDDGPGIDPAVLPRLFEPFASTRLDARGTGLGLAVSEGIVREHGGVLLARNRHDAQGAVFEILLPRRQSGIGPARATAEHT